MRKLSKSEFTAYKCVDCVACEVNKRRPNHGDCMYEVCPFFGVYTGLIKNKGKRRARVINQYKPEPVIVAKAPRKRMADIAYIKSLSERGEYAVDIAKKVKMRPQVVADIIKGGGELVLQ